MTYNDLNYSKMDLGDFSLDELCAAGGGERLPSEAVNIPQMRGAEMPMDSDLDFDINFYEQLLDTQDLTLNQWGFPANLKIEDVFQVDQNDLNLSPTLAKLNSPTDPPPIDKFDYLLPFCMDDTPPSKPIQPDFPDIKPDTTPVTHMDWTLDLTAPHHRQSSLIPTLSSSCPVSVWRNPVTPKKEILPEPMSQSTSISDPVDQKPPPHILRPTRVKEEPTAGLLSTSAPVGISPLRLSLRHRNNSNTDRSLGSFSSLSLSNDEGFDSHCDDSNDDLSSDGESFLEEIDEKVGALADYSNTGTKKKKRYFWQYNTQSKGPKGSRIPLNSDVSDPHLFHDISDPVFSSDCQIAGVKHSGKARRGDGNDLTPNPRKLYTIGLELRKLNKVINDLSPATELDLDARPVTRKEKNKLASRACRLKKKAQHEANKLKLYGLQEEHKRFLTTLSKIKPVMAQMIASSSHDTLHFESLVKQLEESEHVAGNTTEFVNQVLDKVAKGDASGGLFMDKD